jgi:hypothetical protein
LKLIEIKVCQNCQNDHYYLILKEWSYPYRNARWLYANGIKGDDRLFGVYKYSVQFCER